MDKKQHERFLAWARTVGYAFVIWKIGGLQPGKGTVERLDKLERKGRKIFAKYGGGVYGALAYMEAHHTEFRQFLDDGLDEKFFAYWNDVLSASQKPGVKRPLH